MAHYKKRGSHSSKGDNKRIEHKKSRQAEDRALDGRVQNVIRGFDYSIPKMQPPLVAEVGPHRKKRSKKRPLKERCPVNRTHEWYTEVIEEDKFSHYSPYYWLYGLDGIGRRDDATHKVYYKATVRVKTCIHCWKEKKKTLRYEWIRKPLGR